MNTKDMKKTIGRVGILAGVAAFLAFGLMQGALVGGTVGIDTGTYIFGGGLGTRVMAGFGMLAGVVITGAMFVTCGLAAGRLAGFLLLAADSGAAGHDTARTVHTR